MKRLLLLTALLPSLAFADYGSATPADNRDKISEIIAQIAYP